MRKGKATIIGSKGFIGSHLLTRLSAKGWRCHLPKRHEIFERHEDLGHVFYCAGLTADFLARPFDTVEAHVSLLSRILESGRFQSLVYLSSTRLYDSRPGEVCSEDFPLVLDPTNPRHLYDLSKALGESLCFAAGGGKARIARLSCVYNDHTDPDGFLPGLLRRALENHPSALEVDSSPAFARDYVHLNDVLDALILIATHGESMLYNVAGGETVRNETLFSTIESICGCRIIPLRNDDCLPPAEISIRKMINEFSWRPEPVLKKISAILKENLQC